MDRSINHTLPTATLVTKDDVEHDSEFFIVRMLKQLADLFDEDTKDPHSKDSHNNEYIYENEDEHSVPIKTPKLWAKHKERKQLYMNKIYTTLHAIGMFLSLCTLYYNNYRTDVWTSIQKLGCFLFLFSYTMWYLSKIQLGNSFSIQAKASKLITTGIYSKISNPIYIFSGLAILGYILLIDQWIWLFLFIPGNISII